VAVHVNKLETKLKKSSQDLPPKKEDPTFGESNKSDPRPKYPGNPVRKPREIETYDKIYGFWRRFSRMETSFLFFLTLVSNKNN